MRGLETWLFSVHEKLPPILLFATWRYRSAISFPLGDNPVDAGQMRSTVNQLGPVVSEPGKPDPTGIEDQVPTWCRVLDGKWLTGSVWCCCKVRATGRPA